MKVHLHIGRHKTGSTAIQDFLTRNAGRMAERGFLVPRAGRPEAAPKGHHELAWALGRAERLMASWDGALSEMAESGLPACVISSECFDEIDADGVARLGRLLADHETTVVVYLRHQIEALESMYRTNVTHYGLKQFFRAFLARQKPRYDYDRFLAPWFDTFGAENVEVGLYDKAVLREGDVLADFCFRIGLEPDGDFEKPPKEINHGLPSPAVLALLWLHQSGASEERIRHFRQWAWRNAADHTQVYTFLADEEARREMEAFAETNERLRRARFPDIPPDAFLRPGKAGEDRVSPHRGVVKLLANYVSSI